MVLVDDMGFGASSAYGGPCEMPTADRLAEGGLRYSRFHVTALCSPTRQALMTGRNHHSVGMGVTSEMSTLEPGYTGYRPASAATTAQILGGNGYSTAAFGKWHQTPPVEVNASGPFTRWPTGEGFDAFYGFMGAEMNHWYPQLYDGTTPVEPDRSPADGYHLTEDLVDHAVDWVRTQQALTPDKPFFTYLALGATHAPFHVPPSWIERYDGRFDDGWDAQRARTLERQQELGIVPPEAVLAPWAAGVPHWDELDPVAQRVAARFMETYAGFAEHADHHVGRLVDALDELGVLEDTLVVYLLGDNGASGEGGPEGTLREHLVGHGFADDTAAMDEVRDSFGDETTYGIYPVGWALAMNTPYQWTKQVASHYGGTRDGLVVHWPNGMTTRGEVRHQWHHVIDVLPTILDVAGLPHPTTVNGVTQQVIEGTSMRYCFDDAEAPERRSTQYFEMVGNRGVYHDGWTAVTRHGTPWLMVDSGDRPFEDDVWELYDTTTDWTQAHDLAAEQPERLRELQELFVVEAARHQVFPLDDRVTERENPAVAGRLDLHQGRTSIELGPRAGRLTEEAAPNVKNRSHTITVRLVGTAGDSGVLVAQGGRFGGWSLYCLDGRPTYAYNCYGRDLTTVRADRALAPGPHEVCMRFDYAGGPPGDAARVTLLVDEDEVASGDIPATTAYYFAFDETCNVGVDRGSPVTDDYPSLHNAFQGEVRGVRFDLGPEKEPGPEVRRRMTCLSND
jgi:arylsulfatase